MKLQGAGAPGTIDATVDVRFDRRRRRHPTVAYEADAVVGGMVGGVGQRMLDLGVAADGRGVLRQRRRRRSTGDRAGGGRRRVRRGAPRPAPHRAAPGVFTAPAKPAAAGVAPGRLPQGHRRRRRAGAARRRRRRRSSVAASMTDLTVDSTARERRPPYAPAEISARELLDLHLARIAERNPELNAIVSLDEERARAGRGRRRRALAARRRGRPAARAAVRVQGHPRGRRLADDVRLAAASPTTCPTTTT